MWFRCLHRLAKVGWVTSIILFTCFSVGAATLVIRLSNFNGFPLSGYGFTYTPFTMMGQNTNGFQLNQRIFGTTYTNGYQTNVINGFGYYQLLVYSTVQVVGKTNIFIPNDTNTYFTDTLVVGETNFPNFTINITN